MLAPFLHSRFKEGNLDGISGVNSPEAPALFEVLRGLKRKIENLAHVVYEIRNRTLP
jgi:hypothetical protein